jgi:hypothetical protein
MSHSRSICLQRQRLQNRFVQATLELVGALDCQILSVIGDAFDPVVDEKEIEKAQTRRAMAKDALFRHIQEHRCV